MVYHSEKPQTSVPERDMQPQSKAGQHSGREGRQVGEKKKKGKMLVTIKSGKIDTNKLNRFNMKNNRRVFSNALIFTNFCLLKNSTQTFTANGN